MCYCTLNLETARVPPDNDVRSYISTLDTDTPLTAGLLPRFPPISDRVFQIGLGTAHTAAAALSCTVPLWGISSYISRTLCSFSCLALESSEVNKRVNKRGRKRCEQHPVSSEREQLVVLLSKCARISQQMRMKDVDSTLLLSWKRFNTSSRCVYITPFVPRR